MYALTDSTTHKDVRFERPAGYDNPIIIEGLP